MITKALNSTVRTWHQVAADWTRFPRYGYLTQFNKPADADALLRPLRDGLINVVQIYDWMDEHHRPWRVGYDYWQDIAARDPWVSRNKLLELIDSRPKLWDGLDGLQPHVRLGPTR